ncbi:MAG TPA: TolC family protein [Thermoanaerobaculia bacterium]|nr:TolC family protein [Thermoanaerobaculia bacterium]
MRSGLVPCFFRLFRVAALAASGFAALVSPPAAAEDVARVSRPDAVAEALARNPQIAAARAQVEQARAGIAQATAFPDPAFAWTYEQQSSLGNFGSAQTRDVGASLTIPFPDKFRLNRRVSGAALRAAELSWTQLRQQIASQTATAFDALMVAEAQLENDREAERISQDVLAKTQARFDAGTVARLDVLQAKVAFAQARNQTIADERTLMTARASLNRLLARPPGAPIEPAGKLEVPPAPAEVGDLLARAVAHRPEIASIVAQREGARFAAKLAREFWFPDLNISLFRNHTEGFPAAYSTSGAIAVPLFFWQHEKGDVAAAEARQAELAADETVTRAQVELDVRTAWAAADSARRQAVWIRDELLPQANDAFHVASESYALGGSSAVDLINARSALLAATSQLTQALGAANDAAAQLDLAVGDYVPSASQGDSNVP